jgi:methyl-galactoside transport system ATP-binding protein
MVGRDLTHLFPPKDNVPTQNVLLSVRNLTGAYAPTIKDVSFDLYEGEILGIAGLVGSRRTEMVETLFGIRKVESGEIRVRGSKIENANARQSIGNGFALLTEERRRTGIFGELDIAFNSVIASIGNYCSAVGVVNDNKVIKDTQWAIDSLRVKAPSQRTHVMNLSGGNQQKVVLGRWLLTESEILMLDEPTKGIDVGAKFEIYLLMIDIAKRGKGIIFVSSEMPELLGVTDRILVMSGGRVSGIVNTKETTQEEIFGLAAQFL